MTTKVTVDAHAGWPVEVSQLQGEPNYQKSLVIKVVDAGKVEDFYIHSGNVIVGVRELDRNG